MQFLILLLALSYAVHSAIMASNIYTLSRLFQYRLNYTFNHQNLIEYATLAPTMNNCSIGRCFYGWIQNFTQGNLTVEGVTQQIQTEDLFFYIQLFSNQTYNMIRNYQLDSDKKMLLEVTAQLIVPLAAQLSNLSPRNDTSLYEFIPYSQSSQNIVAAELLNLVETKFTTIVQGFQTTYGALGWNQNQPKNDIILFDTGLNFHMARWMSMEKSQLTVEIQLLNKSIFEDLSSCSQVVTALSTEGNNLVNVKIDQNTVFPEKQVLALFL